MNITQADKKKFENITEVVSSTLDSLAYLFTNFGMHGLYELTNPSLPDLKRVIKEMRDHIVDIENDFSDKGGLDHTYALILTQNIKQGLLFAENLLVSVEKLDQSECEKALRDMQENFINHPTW